MTPNLGFAYNLRSRTMGLVLAIQRIVGEREDQPAKWKLNSTLLSSEQSVKLVAAAFSRNTLSCRITTPDRRTGDMCEVLKVDTAGDLSNGEESTTRESGNK